MGIYEQVQTQTMHQFGQTASDVVAFGTHLGEALARLSIATVKKIKTNKQKKTLHGGQQICYLVEGSHHSGFD